jgi:hypothetical protein
VKGGQEMLERDYQKKLVKKLKDIFPGCIVLKNDAQLKQGIPDLTVLYKDKWVALEVKRSESEYRKAVTGKGRPNQDLKVQQMNEMSYASFIYPENEEEVISEMRGWFGV